MTTPLDRIILASRHVLTVFMLGLALALGLYGVRFAWKVWKFGTDLFVASDEDVLLGLLYLLDSALVASLVITVVIASYDGMVSRLAKQADADGIAWIGSVDPGNLKVKLATSIVAISSIHLLSMFLKVGHYSDRDLWMAMALHGMFLGGILMLGLLDRLEDKKDH
ncbi:uncharacterized protein (TIGR00645 family) [Humitalea rosea]|uniref:UPF0114 protein C8P66_12710 n=1 Tax=Humitalea rosea TaxID=990373 RepID=A0A2W7IKB6_9PROT|nr:YqhA family protein [Humitalea rosea]PZW39807.1 uncharacterized protein (TIGR00645 family) [Humitalea rosea]